MSDIPTLEADLKACREREAALAAWACDQYDDGLFSVETGVAHGREILAAHDAEKDAEIAKLRTALLETRSERVTAIPEDRDA